MDMPDNPFIRSPRREIQGPRPTPLKVSKDSHKIRKPPVAPVPVGAAVGAQHYYPHAPPPRPPVIIYTVSPKIIHANPNEFMSLVQRLTGPNSGSVPSSSSSSFQFQDNSSGAVSPAARLASIERTRPPEVMRIGQVNVDYDVESIQGIEIGSDIQRSTGQFPGILSPNPNALPPIPPNFFSPPSDPNNFSSFFPDFSPVALHSNRSYLDNSLLLPSPSTLFSPQINMPSPNTLHLFNTLFDL